MPHQRINGIELYYEFTGDGDETVVLVLGGWTDHRSWQLVDASPAWLSSIVDALASTAYRHAARHTFEGAGHVPHLTDPEGYSAVVRSLVSATRLLPVGGPR